MSVKSKLNGFNGGAADWLIRLVIAALIAFMFTDVRGIHLQQSADGAEIATLKAEVAALRRDVQRLERSGE